jgi:hypothetical protein
VTEVNTNEFTLFKRKRISCVGGSNFVLTYETRRVVVTGGLGVTVGFKYRVGLDDLIFQGTLHWTRIKSQRVRLSRAAPFCCGFYLGQLLGGLLLAGATDFGQVGNDFLHVFSLSGTRFSAVGQMRDLVRSVTRR